MVRLLVALFPLMIFHGAALACTPAAFSGLTRSLAGNERIRINPDCSFSGAGSNRRQTGDGQRSIDNGDGLVSQVLSFGDQCGVVTESILVAECATGNSVVLLPSDSPIIVAADDSIGDVIAKTKRSGGLTMDAEEFKAYVGARRAKDRFDPLCGCKLFYPDSPGARN